MFETGFSLKKLERACRLAIPQLVTAMFIILGLIAVPLPLIGNTKPYLIMMVIYYWSIYRPTLVPPYACFGIGIVIDILSGVPMGLNALVFVALRWVVSDQRRLLTAQPYIAIWAAFGILCLLAALLQWALYGLVHMNWPPLTPLAASVGLSLILFPFVTLILLRVHRLLPVTSRTNL